MAIKGITDRQEAYPIIGTLRKGDPKPVNGNRPGKNLTYFRFTSDDPAVVASFYENYPEKPHKINVLLPADKAEQNFDAWMEKWVAGGLVHRCDGETCVLWRKDNGKYSTEPKPCPGGCDYVGRLAVIIPELGRLATVTILTTSYHDIKNLSAQLRKYEIASPTGSLQGIPFVVTRKKAMISTPMKDGRRARREEWLLSIETQPEWTQRQIAAQQQAALPPVVEVEVPFQIEGSFTELDQLPANVTTPFDDTEIVEESPISKVRQPLAAEKLRDYLYKKVDKSDLRDAETGESFPIIMHPFGKKTAGLVSKKFNEALIAGEPEVHPAPLEEIYHVSIHYLFGVNSANELTAAQADAILDWLLNGNKEDGFNGLVCEPAPAEAWVIYKASQDGVQSELPI